MEKTIQLLIGMGVLLKFEFAASQSRIFPSTRAQVEAHIFLAVPATGIFLVP